MYILGIDEAGRGPLAGPLAIGFVRAPDGFDFLGAFSGLNDSKQLSEKSREVIFALLEGCGEVAYRVEWIEASEIDAHGLTASIGAAVARGVRALMQPEEGKVYLDGSLKAPAEYVQETVIGGDALIPAIMIASVAAKVLRDRKMVELAEKYPGYGFEKHKGYGTKMHYEALKLLGPCDEHRRLFLRKLSK
ncbi:MAG TPA: ribonuclease HII [Candidatus Paceibacterota bacterium]|nr:ribonuclease HII [Candidatus Paceibacterota bacterium]